MNIPRSKIAAVIRYLSLMFFVFPFGIALVAGTISELLEKIASVCVEFAKGNAKRMNKKLAAWIDAGPEGTMERLKKVDYDSEAEKYTRPR